MPDPSEAFTLERALIIIIILKDVVWSLETLNQPRMEIEWRQGRVQDRAREGDWVTRRGEDSPLRVRCCS